MILFAIPLTKFEVVVFCCMYMLVINTCSGTQIKPYISFKQLFFKSWRQLPSGGMVNQKKSSKQIRMNIHEINLWLNCTYHAISYGKVKENENLKYWPPCVRSQNAV